VVVKHIWPEKVKNQTYLWLTLASSTYKLDEKTVIMLKRIRTAVADFCREFVPVYDNSWPSFKIVKLDTTVDLTGSFMPSLDGKAKTLIE